MKEPWLRIGEVRPKHGQHCWYWFEVFKEVYLGEYRRIRVKLNNRVYRLNQFRDDGGFLTEDVTFWIPKNSHPDKPRPPTKAERRTCRYHPLEDKHSENKAV